MKPFLQLRSLSRLFAPLGLALLLSLALAVTAIVRMASLNGVVTELSSNWMPSTEAVLVWKNELQTFRRWQLARLLATGQPAQARYERLMASSLAQLKLDQAAYEATISEAEERAIFPQVLELWSDFRADHEHAMDLLRQDRMDEAKALLSGSSARLFDDITVRLDRVVRINSLGARAAALDASRSFEHASSAILATLAVIVAACLGAGARFLRALHRQRQAFLCELSTDRSVKVVSLQPAMIARNRALRAHQGARDESDW